ncbi:hypothetical protein [Mucilaginibacter sp. cycad4]
MLDSDLAELYRVEHGV